MKGTNMKTRWLAAMTVTTMLLGSVAFLAAQETAAKDSGTRTVKLNIRTTGERRHVENTRGMPFGGAAVIVGTGHERAFACSFREASKIDGKKMAPAPASLYPQRWTQLTMDKSTCRWVVDFQGVKCAGSA
jgi:hypothetical protein